MKNLNLYYKIRKQKLSPSNVRIFTEIDYALQLNKFSGGIFSDIIDNVVNFLGGLDGITQSDILHCEELMKEIGAEAKKQKCICVAHAHMDVNWLWGYDETVAITLSTLETMLMLLEKYENFTYSQSTAFVFRVLEKYRPDLLESVRKYIREGRFEVSGSTFVEADKNLADANSMLRHFSHSREYLSKLLTLPPSYFDMDFEPDTFGHTLYEPEILAESGVKYLYHCRGNDMPPIYRWFAPSGKSVLVYREPFWYNAEIGYGDFEFIPDFCARYGLKKTLKVYGVGDHGGGATIRDVERIIEISSYPVMADIKFGTYREFFRHLEGAENVPQVHGEQNAIFTGCYSSASEIKYKNAVTQSALYEQELFCAVDGDNEYDNTEAVECLLTNQFHDVITGSGVRETAHFAMAEYQRALARLGAFKARALRNFERTIDTKIIFKNIGDADGTAVGAGVGFGAKRIDFTNNIAYGKERAYIIFNQLNFRRTAIVNLQLWDYCGDVSALRAYGADGNELPCTVKSAQSEFYWSHNYHEVDVEITLGGGQYETVVLREQADDGVKQIEYPPLFQRTERIYGDIVLENEYVRATFDRQSFKLISLYDKAAGKERLSGGAGFRLLTEDITEQMTAWYTGRIKNELDVQTNVKFISADKTETAQNLCYRLDFGQSYLDVKVVLENGCKGLKYNCAGVFFEKGSPIDGIPNLSFELPVGNFTETVCDTSPGVITRAAADRDAACASFISANGAGLISNGKHGFRGFDGKLRLCLIRASCDPNPLPEYDRHEFCFGIYLTPEDALSKLRLSQDFRIRPAVISATPHKGERPLKGGFEELPEKAVCISVDREQTVLFNPSDKAITTTVYGQKQTVGANEIKRFKRA